MNLSSLTDLELDASSLVAAQTERKSLHFVLEHLAEVNRRKSFSPKYKSIKHYAMDHMGYDDKSAWSRVNAMYLMVQMPEIKPSIRNGELDLTRLVAVHNHIRNENEAVKKESEPTLFGTEAPKQRMNKQEKLKVINSVKGKASREVIRTLASQSSQPEKLKKPDQVKPMTQELNEVRITLSDEDLKNLQELKELMGHQNLTMSEVISKALKEAKESIEKKKTRGAADKSQKSQTRTPTAATKRIIFTKAKGACEICGSKNSTEIDHIKPWALGGETTEENLRLLCRNCNQREAIKIFGVHLKENSQT